MAGGHLEGQKIEDHGRPAGVAAPAAAEDKRTEDFGHGVMDGRGLKNTGEKVVKKAFQLHVFPGYQPQIYEHVQADHQLHHAAGMGTAAGVQHQAGEQREAYVAEIEEVKYVVFTQPEGKGYGLENAQQKNGGKIFLHGGTSAELSINHIRGPAYRQADEYAYFTK